MHKMSPSRPFRRPPSQTVPPTEPGRLVLLNKPFQVLTQFTAEDGKRTLADVLAAHPSADRLAGCYPAGRLDYDSEGLLLLTSHGPWQARIAHPRHKLVKTYWAQVEGVISEEALQQLRDGIRLKDGPARAVAAEALASPELPPRDPPVRYRAMIPTSWLSLSLDEGRNRQVRRMTAAVGFPTLRLVRVAIGPWTLDGLAPGDWREVPASEAAAVLGR